jgi:Flp pilus assembly protein TadG
MDLDMSILKRMVLGTAGNTTIIFALSVVPMFLAAGAAVDMVRANRTQAVLQGAVDAAALSAAVSGEDESKLKKIVEDYLTANGAQGSLAEVESIDTEVDKDTGKVTVEIKGKIKTSFMKLAGINHMDLSAMSEVSRGVNSMEIALVLDNTDSMNFEGRLEALKKSAKEFVNEVYKSKYPGSYVKIGIVPFSNYVNVGIGSNGESWLNVPPATPVNQCYDTYPDAKSSNCKTVTNAYTTDGVATSGESQVCDWDYGAPKNVCSMHTPVWAGCVGSRNSPLDKQIGTPSSPYPGLLDTYCASPITDLTDDESQLVASIDAMVGVESTFIPAGLLWGWNMLNGAKPLTAAKSGAEMKAMLGKKSIVLMTDGDNTLVPTYPYHSTSVPAPVSDSIAKQICANAKDDEIEIYTVAFKVTSLAALEMLRECASDPSKAFDAGDNENLALAFKKIARELSAVRLSK